MSTSHDSDPSEEGSQDANVYARKRISRACDHCRKTKSKCERPDLLQCKSCTTAGISCTFLGPSFKRGPPKGYIHAIEQRWQQVESLLGVIISCPDSRTQAIVSELRKDKLACEIINRVEVGPFGPANRVNGTNKEDLFAAILHDSHADSARSRRQSRLSRETVSTTQDKSLSAVPTLEWQRNLSNHLSESILEPNPKHGDSSQPNLAIDLSSAPEGHFDMPSYETQMHIPQAWNEMYTMEKLPDQEERDVSVKTPEEMGTFALNENRQAHFRKNTTGRHFLLGCSDPMGDRKKDCIGVIGECVIDVG